MPQIPGPRINASAPPSWPLTGCARGPRWARGPTLDVLRRRASLSRSADQRHRGPPGPILYAASYAVSVGQPVFCRVATIWTLPPCRGTTSTPMADAFHPGMPRELIAKSPRPRDRRGGWDSRPGVCSIGRELTAGAAKAARGNSAPTTLRAMLLYYGAPCRYSCPEGPRSRGRLVRAGGGATEALILVAGCYEEVSVHLSDSSQIPSDWRSENFLGLIPRLVSESWGAHAPRPSSSYARQAGPDAGAAA